MSACANCGRRQDWSKCPICPDCGNKIGDPGAATTEPRLAPRADWRETVRSWGLEPFEDEKTRCKGSWRLGTACGRCWYCGSCPERPPAWADVGAYRRAMQGHPAPCPGSPGTEGSRVDLGALKDYGDALDRIATALRMPGAARLDVDVSAEVERVMAAHDDLCASLGRLFDCKATPGSTKRFLWQNVLSSRLWALLADAEGRFRRLGRRPVCATVTAGEPAHPADFSVVVPSKRFGEVVEVAVSTERPADLGPPGAPAEGYIVPRSPRPVRSVTIDDLTQQESGLHLSDVIGKHLEDHLEAPAVKAEQWTTCPECEREFELSDSPRLQPPDYDDALALVERLAAEARPEGIERCGLEKAAEALRRHRVAPPTRPARGS